jgi:hypothetical protein
MLVQDKIKAVITRLSESANQNGSVRFSVCDYSN